MLRQQGDHARFPNGGKPVRAPPAVQPAVPPENNRSTLSKSEKRIQKMKKVKKKMTGLFSAFLAAVTALSVVKEKVPLDKRPHIVCQVQDKKLSALVDTGATVSVMSKKMFESLQAMSTLKKYQCWKASPCMELEITE